eukprot:6632629-Pyramimonas_sp.AAC.1
MPTSFTRYFGDCRLCSCPQLELSTENTESICQDNSNNTNRFADLARLADRVQTVESRGERAR